MVTQPLPEAQRKLAAKLRLSAGRLEREKPKEEPAMGLLRTLTGEFAQERAGGTAKRLERELAGAQTGIWMPV